MAASVPLQPPSAAQASSPSAPTKRAPSAAAGASSRAGSERSGSSTRTESQFQPGARVRVCVSGTTAEEWALSETDIRGKVREDFIKAGISGQNAEAAASLMQAGMEAMAQLSGTTPLQEYENFHLSIQNQSEALKTDTEEQTVQMSPEEAEALEPLTPEEERYIRSLMEQQEQLA